MKRINLIIEGYVQGIGYRYFIMRSANMLKITGWVRNHTNGNVEVEVQGEEKVVTDFVNTLKTRHRWAKIDNIYEKLLPVNSNEFGFDIKY